VLYENKFEEVLEQFLYGGRGRNAQSNPHHVVIWAILLQMHLNLWMHAMVNKQLRYLTEKFDTVFSATYLPLLNDAVKGGEKTSFQAAVMICDYRCSEHDRRGTSDLFCPKCQSKKPTAASTKVAAESAPAAVDNTADKAWWEKCNAWRDKQLTSTGKKASVTDYLATDSKLRRPADPKPQAKKSATVVKAASAKATWADYTNCQNQLVQHVFNRA
jgi:hypothetical protein